MLQLRTVFAFIAGVAASLALAQSFHDAPASTKDTKNPISDPAGARAGAALYDKNCSGCHGNQGEGAIDGPALNSDAAKKASDGELFWFITHGNPANGMPAWESLPEAQRWQLVDFVRALQSGRAPTSGQESAAAVSPNAPFTDYRYESPGAVRKITVADLPKPYATQSSNNSPHRVKRPDGAMPKTKPGFKVGLYADDLDAPRLIRTAPNGDYFTALTRAGEIMVFRGITADGKPEQSGTFAEGLNEPFGIAFYPPGPNPKYVYIGNTDAVVRISYQNGDMKARGAPEHILDLPHGRGHSTRDIQFSPDGKQMFLSVGSGSNVNDPDSSPEEKHRADILVATPDGQDVKVFASGIRNAVGLAIQPNTGELWCSVNERDGLGDNLVPDYITHVQENGFYGWPWWYIGAHQDPRLDGKHRELRSKVIVPDVLLQPHNASLQMTFYDGTQFPSEYGGDIFAAEHGSWNKSTRAGYEVIRVPLHQSGKASGEYEDFLTGFVLDNGDVWGRPVGVTVATDGSLLVTDDGSGSIWRVSYSH
jgi:glucose/arabinose dehydrogenase/mono/diheme cytochrome c family protein